MIKKALGLTNEINTIYERKQKSLEKDAWEHQQLLLQLCIIMLICSFLSSVNFAVICSSEF